jgi:iron(III) transport system ATP-binding protein
MILRPFNFDTLATEAFQLATTERLDQAALPSCIAAAGLIPVVLLCLAMRRARQRSRRVGARSMTALRFTDVDHAYGSRVALRSFSLGVEDGEIVSLLGPSGSGKTTALRIAAGLETPQRGTVHVGARLVQGGAVNVPPEARDVGLLFQDLALFPHLTVAENVGFGLRGGGKARRARVDELLALVGLGPYARVYPHQLSGGQQQRVALARALAPKPSVLLLDEPFSNLDVVLRQQVRREMAALLKQIGTSVLLVTHDPEEALYISDRVAVMREGTIVQVETPEALYLAPADRFVASFFGHINVIPASVKDGRATTPFGSVAATGCATAPADVLVRAQGCWSRRRPVSSMPSCARRVFSGPTILLELGRCPRRVCRRHWLRGRRWGAFAGGRARCSGARPAVCVCVWTRLITSSRLRP